MKEQERKDLMLKLRHAGDVLLQLRLANYIRVQDKTFGHMLEEWSPTDYGCAVAGEVGELCNKIKKLHRGDEISIEEIAKEAADVVCYLDLLCQRLGIDLKTAIVNKFNEVSEVKGSDVTIYYY